MSISLQIQFLVSMFYVGIGYSGNIQIGNVNIFIFRVFQKLLNYLTFHFKLLGENKPKDAVKTVKVVLVFGCKIFENLGI